MNLSVSSIADLSERVAAAKAEHDQHYSGPPAGRQPVHTVYVAADRFSSTLPTDFGTEALRLFNTHTPGAGSFGSTFAIDPELAGPVRERVAAKLAAEPIEDLRIDFEDGYGVRDDEDEDAHVAQVVEAVATAYQDKTLPHYWGIRVKSFAEGGHERAMRTLDGFLTALRDRLGRLPGGFVITFPKVRGAGQVEIFTDYLGRLEEALGLPAGILRFEVQIDSPQALIDRAGRVALPAIAAASGGRVTAAHFGVPGFTAEIGLPAQEQRLDHPACDFARELMRTALAGTPVRISDGSTDVVPRNDGPDEISRTWAEHSRHVRHSLRNGFYQGWDLHPAHLPSRYAAVYAFHLTGIDEVIGRLRAIREQVAGAPPAPAQVAALNDRLRRAVECGALDESELPTG